VIAEGVYILCALTSIACAVLLFRGYRRSRARFLLWCALCFVGLAANNVLLFLDLIVFVNIDLSVWRSATATAGLMVLVIGLVWEG
jgi:hypothetical protein